MTHTTLPHNAFRTVALEMVWRRSVKIIDTDLASLSPAKPLFRGKEKDFEPHMMPTISVHRLLMQGWRDGWVWIH